jgi:hypothetical protein
MARVESLSVPQFNLWERLKTFVNSELVNILAALLFLLLAIFLLYPILAVLIKSIKGLDRLCPITLNFANIISISD